METDSAPEGAAEAIGPCPVERVRDQGKQDQHEKKVRRAEQGQTAHQRDRTEKYRRSGNQEQDEHPQKTGEQFFAASVIFQRRAVDEGMVPVKTPQPCPRPEAEQAEGEKLEQAVEQHKRRQPSQALAEDGANGRGFRRAGWS